MPDIALSDAQRWKLHQSKVIAAYKRVFGDNDKTRTDDQRTVWKDLEIAGYSKARGDGRWTPIPFSLRRDERHV